MGREAELLVSDSVHVNVSGAVDGDGYGLRNALNGQASQLCVAMVLTPHSGSSNESLTMHVCACQTTSSTRGPRCILFELRGVSGSEHCLCCTFRLSGC